MKAEKPRPGNLSPVSAQMKAWSIALASEVADWPRATARSFFGFTALYRGDNIFGIVPRTRGFGNGNLLAFRIDDLSARSQSRMQQDHRLGVIDRHNSRWFTFELSCDADLHPALDWLDTAYQSAGKRRKSRR